MKHIYMSSKHKNRRLKVIERLEAQLKEGVKFTKEIGKDKTDTVPLTEGDKQRITNELETLRKRV